MGGVQAKSYSKHFLQLNYFEWESGDHVSFIEYSPRWQNVITIASQFFTKCLKGRNCSVADLEEISCVDGQNISSNTVCQTDIPGLTLQTHTSQQDFIIKQQAKVSAVRFFYSKVTNSFASFSPYHATRVSMQYFCVRDICQT